MEMKINIVNMWYVIYIYHIYLCIYPYINPIIYLPSNFMSMFIC